ncbi:MAG: hypothetical protein KGL93_05980 [Gemmatimonadota bacterium]|nr:hypothetical protein [Gemmatimonadota bacterium]
MLMVVIGALSACRADSLSAPQAQDCAGQPGCRTSPSAPVDPTVFASLSDGVQRLAPSLGTGATQTALTNALITLNQALEAGHDADARTALAEVYGDLDQLRVAGSDGTPVDLPDASALRLELILVANALGVHAQ